MNDDFLTIVNIILDIAQELNENLEHKIPLELGVNAPLYGRKGVLDSMGLVTLIVAVEQNIEEEFNTELFLADEKALSQTQSPFRNIETLANYIYKILNRS